MRKILLIGAGRSSSSLIKYFLDNAQHENWQLIVADVSEEFAQKKVMGHSSGKAIRFDIQNAKELTKIILSVDIVISMLPAHMHLPVAMECLKSKKNLVTASYVSPEMNALHEKAVQAGILLMNECGLDPGLDHMSAMMVFDEVKKAGGKLTSFRSYTGGLVAPESNDNPWGYKFSWNPRNVILAGQGTARFIENGRYKYIPYNRLFTEIENIHVDGMGDFDGYANRDSLSYRKTYQLEDIPTMVRGTLRQSGFCKAWNVFVQLGLTDDSYILEDSEHLTYQSLVEAYLPASTSQLPIDERLAVFMNTSVNSKEMQLIRWTGILEDKVIGLARATPAQVLQKLLEVKWLLKDEDKDMIVMQHQFQYELKNKKYLHTSSLVVKGESSIYTAMAKTVGVPVAIAAKLILNGKILLKGVQVPVDPTVYSPILNELKEYGVSFEEKRTELA